MSEADAVGEPSHHCLGLIAPELRISALELGELLDILATWVRSHRTARLAELVVEDIEALGREHM